MKILVFGASGKVGRLLVEELLQEGHQVTAFIHKTALFYDDKNLEIISGDIYSESDVSRAVWESEIVISTLGSWGTKRKDVVSSAMLNIIPAMQEAGVNRIITLTGMDAYVQDERHPLLARITHSLIKISPARKILLDGERHIKLLAHSGLEWTVLRSPIMNKRGKPERYVLSANQPLPLATINRQSVVKALAALLIDQKYYRQSPYIRRK